MAMVQAAVRWLKITCIYNEHSDVVEHEPRRDEGIVPELLVHQHTREVAYLKHKLRLGNNSGHLMHVLVSVTTAGRLVTL